MKRRVTFSESIMRTPEHIPAGDESPGEEPLGRILVRKLDNLLAEFDILLAKPGVRP